MNTTIETITPKLAAQYLGKLFDKQRPLRKAWIETLAEHIRKGTYHLTHQGIAFDTAGKLFDGQHRLQAVILSERAVKMNVTRGVDPSAWHATDIGQKRSYADITGIPKQVAEPLRLIARLFRVGDTSYIPAEEIIRLYETEVGQNLQRIHDTNRNTRRNFSSAPFKIAAAMWMCRDSEYPLAQYSALVMQDYDAMSPASKSLTRQFGQKTLPKGDILARAFRVFNPKNSKLAKLTVRDLSSVMSELKQMLDELVNF